MLGLNGACEKRGFDAPGARVTYQRFSGHRTLEPEFELTVERGGIVRLHCRRLCAASGEVSERIPEARTRAVFEALEKSGFFKLTRTTNVTTGHGEGDTITYRDAEMIYEVSAAGVRVPQLVSVLRSVIDVDALLKPSIELYRRRLANGWAVDSVDESQTGAIDVAALACDVDSSRFLVDHGAIPTEAALQWATRCNDPAVMNLLLSKRAPAPESEEARRLLVVAVGGGHAEIVRVLLDRGFTVSAQDTEKRTPLAAAIGANSWTMIDLLLSRGANPNATTPDGRPILWLAARSFNTAGIVLLARYGAKINAQDATGRTALMHAAEACQAWSVKALLEAGADPLLRDRNGRTAADFRLPPNDGNADKCVSSQKLLTGPGRSMQPKLDDEADDHVDRGALYGERIVPQASSSTTNGWHATSPASRDARKSDRSLVRLLSADADPLPDHRLAWLRASQKIENGLDRLEFSGL